jgi:hypothetical protein
VENKFIEPLRGYNPEYLGTFPHEVRSRWQCGDTAWEQMVPEKVAAKIKEKKLFGYKPARFPVSLV